jgi:phosphoenolpyruvate synthase/pyruvate phosphate dikinase
VVLPAWVVTHEQWIAGHSIDLPADASGKFIVRSSARREDGEISAHAGEFRSISELPIDGINKAVRDVFDSYGKPNADDQVLVQPMLESVRRSGVIMTRDPLSGSPYIVIESAKGSDTSAVTGGKSGTTTYVTTCRYMHFGPR